MNLDSLPRLIRLEDSAKEKKTNWRTVCLPNGHSIAVASADRTIHVHDAKTGDMKYKFAGHNNALRCLETLGADLLVSGDVKGVLCLWRAGSGEKVFAKDMKKGTIWAIKAWDNKRFFFGTATGKLVVCEHHDEDGEDAEFTGVVAYHDNDSESSAVLSLAVDRDRVAYGLENGRAVILRNQLGSSSNFEFIRTLEGHDQGVFGIAINKKNIATATGKITKNGHLGSPGSVSIYDSETFVLLKKLGSDFIANNLANVQFCWEKYIMTIGRARKGTGHGAGTRGSSLDITDIDTGVTTFSIALPFPCRDVFISEDDMFSICGMYGEACVFPCPFDIDLDSGKISYQDPVVNNGSGAPAPHVHVEPVGTTASRPSGQHTLPARPTINRNREYGSRGTCAAALPHRYRNSVALSSPRRSNLSPSRDLGPPPASSSVSTRNGFFYKGLNASECQSFLREQEVLPGADADLNELRKLVWETHVDSISRVELNSLIQECSVSVDGLEGIAARREQAKRAYEIPTPPPEPIFGEGTKVFITGLQSEDSKDMNGKTGIVLPTLVSDEQRGRVLVRMDDDKYAGHEFSLKCENVTSRRPIVYLD